jgi:Glycosyltransferases involved in cell wall biogenesis
MAAAYKWSPGTRDAMTARGLSAGGPSPDRHDTMSAAFPLTLSRQNTESAEDDQTATGRMPLTVVIPVLDEAEQIGYAIECLSWADDVIVVDGGSTDETATIARAAGAQVLVLAGDTIAGQRNLGIASARHNWVLTLDADERVTPQLRAEIGKVVRAGRVTRRAYRIRFRNHYLGRELRHGPWGRDWHVRLFTRDRRYVPNRVHEHLESIDDVGTLDGQIIHYPYRDLAHHVAKIVRYARWGAEDLHARGRTAGAWEVVVRPAWRFARDYIVFSGWRDGLIGFVASAMNAFASFLKYAFLFSRSHATRA